MQKSDGMNYAPVGQAKPVVGPGDFVFAASHLEHGHIYGQVNGLLEAGAVLKWVYDPDPAKVAKFTEKYPQARAARTFAEVLDDPAVRLVASAGVPNTRGPTGCQVLRAGKDYFVDKAPFTTLDQLAEARKTVAATGRKYGVYYGERQHNLPSWHATDLILGGAVGRVLQVLIMAPHRLSKPSRPEWFWVKEQFGGILTDIGSHQFEQILAYTGATDGEVLSARVENFSNPDRPEFEDYGEATLRVNTGASGYARVDWFTPAGLPTWGDGRAFVLGTDGYLEIRKYTELGGEKDGGVYLCDAKGVRRLAYDPAGGYPFFGAFVLDCLHRTELAQTQAHAFKAAELCLKAQALADATRR